MAVDVNQMAADDAAYFKQAATARDAQAAKEAQEKAPPSLATYGTAERGHVTSGMLDGIVNEVEQWGTAAKRVGQDVAAGVTTAAVNTADAAGSAISTSGREMAAAEDPAHAQDALAGQLPTSEIWDHAKASILDFRDAISVKDPNAVDNLTQAGAQLAVPFAAYSKALAVMHGFSKVAAAGAITDMTALQPHDMRTADLIALGRQTDTKIGAVLRQMGPYGLNAYVNYLADRTDETEAQGRFKNALDGLGSNLILTPLLHAAGIVVKQGTTAARYLAENGVRQTLSDLAPPMKVGPAAQEGKIVFHGTASDFDEFQDGAIGSGEGNQAFGHGHYFAENPETAGHYKQMLVGRTGATGAAMSDAAAAVKAAGGRAQAYTKLSQDFARSTDPAERADLQRQMQLIKSGNYDRGSGKLMHVEIPDEHINDMIHWDQPIKKQPNLQKLISGLDVKITPEGGNFRVTVNGKRGGLYMDEDAARRDTFALRGAGNSSEFGAGMFYDELSSVLGSPKEASAFLSRRGIPGIRFLDQGSRDAGEGTHNIVLFNPKHAKIVKKE